MTETPTTSDSNDQHDSGSRPLGAELDSSLVARFEFDAIVKEYDCLRAEVSARIQKQQDITNFSIVLAGGFIALGKVFFNAGHASVTATFPLFFPIISIILTAFALMILEHESNIVLIYRYGDTDLRPRLQNLLPSNRPTIWDWNTCRATWQHHDGYRNIFYYVMSWAKYAMTILPSMLLAIAYCHIFGSDGPWWEMLLWGIWGVLTAFFFFAAAFVGNQYNRMGRRR